MIFWIEMIFLVFFISALLTGVSVPRILEIAFLKKLFDNPDLRKIHKGVVPRLGGISFLPAIMCALAIVLGWSLHYDEVNVCTVLSAENIVNTLMLACSLLLLYFVGIADDLVGVRYRAKFIVQIICALLIISGGEWITDFNDLLCLHSITPWVGIPLTVLFFVYILNALNLIDGIDGLASGISILTLLFYGFIFLISKEYLNSMIAMATAGALMTFFYYNVFGTVAKKNKIFMGDTGSLTVGMVLAFLSLELLETPLSDDLSVYNPWILAFSPLVVPLFDVVRVFMYRIRNHRNPFLPDKSHIHHKLMALGMSPANVLLLILCVSILFTLLNMFLSPYLNVNLIILTDIILWTIWNLFLTSRIRRLEKQLGERRY